MKILVTFAVPTEFAAWRRQHGFQQVARDPVPLYAADIGGSTVRVVLTGIGTVAARRAMRSALASPVDLCISSGFAAALRPNVGVGEVVAGRLVRHAERDLAVTSDCELLAAACDARARHMDRFLTTERVVLSAAEKYALADEADAVETESFVILAEAARHGVRAVAVRAVSDTVETSLPYDFNRTIDARGYIRLSALITAVIRQPQRLPALLRLGLDCRLAARQLADFLDRYVGLLYSRLDLSQSEMAAAT